jgi:hypothetical protein
MTVTAERSTHRCPIQRCPRDVPDHLLMCGIHWRLVPHNVRRSVNRAYAGGAGLGTAQLAAAQVLAIRLVNERLDAAEVDA